MTYIRTKNIYGNEYAYLVESKKTKQGNRQKVKQYLGKVFDLEAKASELPSISLTKKKDFLLRFVLHELEARGFEAKKGVYVYKNLIFDPKSFSLQKQTKSQTLKDAILKCADGYLCTFTLQRINSFKKGKDLQKDAETLAKYFLEAGLDISREDFIAYYQLL